MSKEKIVKEFAASEATEQKLLYWSAGGNEQEDEGSKWIKERSVKL